MGVYYTPPCPRYGCSAGETILRETTNIRCCKDHVKGFCNILNAVMSGSHKTSPSSYPSFWYHCKPVFIALLVRSRGISGRFLEGDGEQYLCFSGHDYETHIIYCW